MRHIFEDFRRALELNRKSGKKGFSLIELLVVIAIIAILAAIAIPQYNKYRANAMLSNVQGLTKSITTDAIALATTSAQNPDPDCRFTDHVEVYTYNNTNATNGTDVASASKVNCDPNHTCLLVAIGKNNATCDYNTVPLPGWVEKVNATLKMDIYGTNATISEGAVYVLSNYKVGANKKIGCVYNPANDVMGDAGTISGTDYVCKTF